MRKISDATAGDSFCRAGRVSGSRSELPATLGFDFLLKSAYLFIVLTLWVLVCSAVEEGEAHTARWPGQSFRDIAKGWNSGFLRVLTNSQLAPQ